ncbi:DUF3320 domain-containing protein, partial [Porphyromonas loveana]
EMIIYTSLNPEQIDLKRTNSLGVEGLRLLLEFAKHGLSHLPNRSAQFRAESDVVADLAKALRARGYKVDTMIGCSNFKIDLGIRHPHQADQYILGILSDGKSYYETKTTRDREIVQPGVLRMLGWNIHRVWTVDWMENPDRILSRIAEQVESLLSHAPAAPEAAAPTVKKFSVESAAPLRETGTKEQAYRSFAASKPTKEGMDMATLFKMKTEVRKTIQSIIQTEQPITDTLLCRRLAEYYGIGRVSTRLRSLVDALTEKYHIDPISFAESRTFWIDRSSADGFEGYRSGAGRDITEIPTVEVMNAARYVMEEQLAMPLIELRKHTAQQLGFARTGAKVQAHVDYAIDQLIKSGKLRATDRHMISLAE